jgi:hypothetical protein
MENSDEVLQQRNEAGISSHEFLQSIQEADVVSVDINSSSRLQDKFSCEKCPSESLGKTVEKAIYLFGNVLGSAMQLPGLVGAFGSGLVIGGVSGGILTFGACRFLYRYHWMTP